MFFMFDNKSKIAKAKLLFVSFMSNDTNILPTLRSSPLLSLSNQIHILQRTNENPRRNQIGLRAIFIFIFIVTFLENVIIQRGHKGNDELGV